MAVSGNPSSKSLINSYELALLEAKHSCQIASSVELYKCFEIFDELIPMLGQYKRVIKMIRDHLFDAVFSREYTVNIQLPSLTGMEEDSKTASIKRIPHFVILNKLADERNNRAERAEEKISQLTNRLEESRHEIQKLEKCIANQKSINEKQEENMQELQRIIKYKEEENTSLSVELRYQKEKLNCEINELNDSIESLRKELKGKTDKINALNQFKLCHDKVQDDFHDPSVFTPAPQKKSFSAEEQKLRKDIVEGKSLETQLLSLRNTCIEQYDEYLEEWNILKKSKDNDVAVDENHSKRKIGFIKMITSIENELSQTSTHLSILKDNLEQVNVKDDMMEDSNLLHAIKDSSLNCTFVPQEAIFSKYAVVLEYSCNKGRTFQEMPGLQHCQSCAAKTLVCPHKATSDETVFHLPLKCTYIKFVRPQPSVFLPSNNSQKETSVIGNEDIFYNIPQSLWNDLANREEKTQQRVPMTLKTEFIVSLIEQFYAFVHAVEVSDSDDITLSILDVWHKFLNERYQSKSVANLMTRAVLETIQRSNTVQQFIEMFIECLSGILDPATFRYFLIVRKLIQSVSWKSLDDFAPFASIIYPFMDVDDLEQFTMSFRAYSENTINEECVRNFFLSLILKQREPAFHDMENQLLSRSEVINGIMSESVFIEAMVEISPLISEKSCKSLLAQSKAGVKDKCPLSIVHLSQIACYLVLCQQTSVVEMKLNAQYS
ncbi:uncharacterized protein LOC124447082 [Xenia sp. Carnegie-2017]|uniref:uncharacterized protein LOC124447082 n=1 Tax=Xenia sp. Carnegie-2017 TaxID=2897299 RepID=UPI001F04A736|nr:uncharacterized protein LOC124447082 [Xenia sp. Carnegie-2017]